MYLHEMKNLPVSHPLVFEHLSAGLFVVQPQDTHPFSPTACDQAIEVTCNRDTKTKGGIIGFSQSVAALHRWIMSHHERGAIARKCLEMAGESTADSSKKDLGASEAKRNERMIMDLKETVVSLQNPFTYKVEEMISISTGIVPGDSIEKDMLTAYEIGKMS